MNKSVGILAPFTDQYSEISSIYKILVSNFRTATNTWKNVEELGNKIAIKILNAIVVSDQWSQIEVV